MILEGSYETSNVSALEVSYDNALYKFTFDIDIDLRNDSGPKFSEFRHLCCTDPPIYRCLFLFLLLGGVGREDP